MFTGLLTLYKGRRSMRRVVESFMCRGVHCTVIMIVADSQLAFSRHTDRRARFMPVLDVYTVHPAPPANPD
ncbi:hypothetical protein E2C01_093737 [Portunus trituberculatus]|uniref:Uncharacterized protein n=1 Tax=Portunus trituberculatus TaxID=210409 RepID=A0A5B7JZI7_PORTR|nr:hypothetical protein [Portunus trituberculatus]